MVVRFLVWTWLEGMGVGEMPWRSLGNHVGRFEVSIVAVLEDWKRDG